MGILSSCLRSDESRDKTSIYIDKHSTNKLKNYRSRCIPLESWNAQFLYTILKWRTEWLNKNFPSCNTTEILGSKYKLIPTSLNYNSWDDYKQTMEPLMVLEFFHTLRKDNDDLDYNNCKPRSLDCIVEKCETEVINQTLEFKKLTINVVMEKNVVYNYPLVGDLLKVTCSNQQECFGYVENIENFRQNHINSINHVLTVLIENIDTKIITITTVKSILINLKMLLALHDLSKSQFLPLILKPNHDHYSTLENGTILPLMLEQPLNGNQMKIVANVVNTAYNNPTPKICLIHGPPGTGKSTVIISIISEIMKIKKLNQKMRILLCSSSNFAVDAVLMKLLNVKSSLESNGIELNIARIGVYDKTDDRVKSVTLPTLPMKPTREDHELERNIILKADIIAATLGSCYSKKMEELFGNKKGSQQIQVCIVDEAGQSTEIETLIPLMLGVKLVVLVGDPQQLQPTIISDAARVKGMGKSLFARAQECFGQSQYNFLTNPTQLLNTQYRMTNEIVAWPNAQFYHSRILNAANNKHLFKFNHYKVLSHSHPQCGKDKNECESNIIVNLLEVIITELVTLLKTRQTKEFPSIGVITPYCDQKITIENMIKKKWPCDCQNVDVYNKIEEIEVNTLDSFQGKEKDIIIMSCVRTRSLGFLKNPNRLNVGLTRAKQAMIVCGNFKSSIYQTNGMWKSMINNAIGRRCFHEVNKNMEYEYLRGLIFY